MNECPAEPVNNAEPSLSEPLVSPASEPHYCFSDLVGLLKAQTLALNALTNGIERLAQSNEALVDVMCQQAEEQDEAGSPHL